MTWARLDDKIHSHAKTFAAGNAAFGLFCRLLAWCCDHLTDGHIPRCVCAAYDDDDGKQIERLIDVGWLVETEDGFEIHDYLEHNPSAAEVAKSRKVRAKSGSLGGKQSASKRQANAKQVATGLLELCSGDAEAKPNPDPEPIPNKKERASDDAAVMLVWGRFLERREAAGLKHAPTLTPKRKAHIRARLKDSTVAELLAAIDALWASNWHVENRQLDPDLVFRSRERVEMLITRATQVSLPISNASGPAPMSADEVDRLNRSAEPTLDHVPSEDLLAWSAAGDVAAKNELSRRGESRGAS